jgi:hypothetical protein
MPIYVISQKVAKEGDKPRLVRAKNQSAALKHVADELQVAHASQDDLVRLVSDGVRVEVSEKEPAV